MSAEGEQLSWLVWDKSVSLFPELTVAVYVSFIPLSVLMIFISSLTLPSLFPLLSDLLPGLSRCLSPTVWDHLDQGLVQEGPAGCLVPAEELAPELGWEPLKPLPTEMRQEEAVS